MLSALGWDLILRFLGYRIGVGRAQVAWGQPMLARYVPGSVLYVLGRVLLSERAGVPRRITVASIVYEQAISATSAIIFAAYFFIDHPDLQGQPLRWAFLLLIPLAIVVLHPRVFGPLADRVLRAFGREPLPAVISMRRVLALLAFYLLNWVVIAVGVFCVARSVSDVSADEILTVGSAQALGYVAALATLVAPAGLGVRDAVFAWAVKGAVPGQSFAVGSLIAIAVRGVLTVVEVLYVAAVTALGRRQGWSIHTGVFHASPEEEAAEEAGGREGRARARRNLSPHMGASEFGGGRWPKGWGRGLAALLALQACPGCSGRRPPPPLAADVGLPRASAPSPVGDPPATARAHGRRPASSRRRALPAASRPRPRRIPRAVPSRGTATSLPAPAASAPGSRAAPVPAPPPPPPPRLRRRTATARSSSPRTE